MTDPTPEEIKEALEWARGFREDYKPEERTIINGHLVTLAAAYERLEKRLAYKCLGCPGCPNDCPDMIDHLQARLAKAEKALRMAHDCVACQKPIDEVDKDYIDATFEAICEALA